MTSDTYGWYTGDDEQILSEDLDHRIQMLQSAPGTHQSHMAPYAGMREVLQDGALWAREGLDGLRRWAVDTGLCCQEGCAACPRGYVEWPPECAIDTAKWAQRCATVRARYPRD